ncbi:MAG: hypothetical protein ABR95_03040 [Sphingobacteriales bacterium BACL12 MAG-120813-bin55]|jgi:hypothetical protein|nr:MAG: hypothetical protein ABR94_03720 [Sphingobacteriales bacterium BACL12 MAG-120802-bin5]KRP12539.1 MAG: hypothetical protein ABR95_03040 [Sphingobacteriales bacterium BACL12 MAG-120813-bin55]
MLKFFRKIRQQLLSQNKFNKYLIYAIGEIILVVIGILIAVQINNWNDRRKDQQEEIILLKSLQRDLHSDMENIQLRMDRKRAMLTGFIHCLEILSDKREGTKEEFMQHYEMIMQVDEITLNTTTFNNLQNNGVIKLIRNKRLADSIVAYYNTDLNGWQSSLREYSRNNFAPYLLSYDFLPEVTFELSNIDAELQAYLNALPGNSEFSFSGKSLEDYKNNYFIINMLKFKSRNVIGILGEYKALLGDAEQLDKSIQNHISTYD